MERIAVIMNAVLSIRNPRIVSENLKGQLLTKNCPDQWEVDREDLEWLPKGKEASQSSVEGAIYNYRDLIANRQHVEAVIVKFSDGPLHESRNLNMNFEAEHGTL